MPKPKPQAPGATGGKAARDRDDKALTRAHKAGNVDGSLRAMMRLIRGGN